MENNIIRDSFRSNKPAAHELKSSSCQCGSNNFFTQEKGPHLGLYCRDCNRWQSWIAQNKPLEMMPFGLFKDTEISKLPIGYLDWILTANVHLSASLRSRLEDEFEIRGGV